MTATQARQALTEMFQTPGKYDEPVLDARIRAQIAANERQIAEDLDWLRSRGWTQAEIEQGKRTGANDV